jgi:hypothetical protein
MSLHLLYSQIISAATNVSSEVTIKVNCFKKIVTCTSLVETTTLIVTNLQFSSKKIKFSKHVYIILLVTVHNISNKSYSTTLHTASGERSQGCREDRGPEFHFDRANNFGFAVFRLTLWPTTQTSSGPQVEAEWSYTTLPLHVFLVWYLIKRNDNFVSSFATDT